VLLGKEETVQIGIGRIYGMEMNMEKTKVMRISRVASLLQFMMDFSNMATMINDASWACKIKARIALAKAAFNRKTDFSPANWT
jgi:hypothetical protein